MQRQFVSRCCADAYPLHERLTKRAPDPSTGSGTAGGSLRVFRQFACLEVGSGKAALSRPTHQPSSGCYAMGNASR